MNKDKLISKINAIFLLLSKNINKTFLDEF